MEFHAIILCGSGKRLAPLNSVSVKGLENLAVPKALMPVGNIPVIANPLSWCEKAGFSEITVVCENRQVSEIKAYIDDKYPKDRVTFNISNSHNQNIRVTGVDSATTESLVPIFKNDVKHDFVCMACDFITDVEPETLLDHHRNRSKDTIMTGIYYRNNIETIDKKSLKPGFLLHTSFKNKSPLLLDIYSREKVAEKKTLHVRDAMVIRHPNSVISTDILPSTIYFCSHRLVDAVISEYQAEKDANTTHKVSIKDRTWTKVTRDIARRSWQHSKPYDTVAMALIDSDKTFIRTESLSAYMEANRWVMKQKAQKSAGTRPTPSTKGAATVGADSQVGEDTVLGERTSVKKSVIGNNCVLGKRCRLTGCVILDGAKIADDVHLENCLIGKNVVLNAKCRLTNCTVEGGYEISKDTQAKDEKFESFGLNDTLDNNSSVSYSGSESDDNSDDDEGSEYSDGRGDSDDDGLFDRS